MSPDERNKKIKDFRDSNKNPLKTLFISQLYTLC